MNPWEQLVSHLAGLPELPEARCRGRHELFDATIHAVRGDSPDTIEYARTAAMRLCQHCPALDRCTAWFDSLPPPERPLGVVAGQINRVTPGMGAT